MPTTTQSAAARGRSTSLTATSHDPWDELGEDEDEGSSWVKDYRGGLKHRQYARVEDEQGRPA